MLGTHLVFKRGKLLVCQELFCVVVVAEATCGAVPLALPFAQRDALFLLAFVHVQTSRYRLS